jgi:hypothetical protein
VLLGPGAPKLARRFIVRRLIGQIARDGPLAYFFATTPSISLMRRPRLTARTRSRRSVHASIENHQSGSPSNGNILPAAAGLYTTPYVRTRQQLMTANALKLFTTGAAHRK